MKKRIFLLCLAFCAVLFAFNGNAQSDGSGDSESGPVISFEHEIHNFGNVKEGPKLVYDFVFTNTGNAPLIINSCKPQCTCTNTKCPKEPIMPGEKGIINAGYATVNRKGSFTKNLRVNSNAINGVVVLYIKGRVEPKPEDRTKPIKPPGVPNN